MCRKDPVSKAVVRFLGDCLEIECEVREGHVFVGPRDVPIANHLAETGKAQLFIRPWQLEIVDEGEGHIRGTVKSMFTSQGRAHISVEHSDGQLFTVTAASGSCPQPNGAIDLKITGGHLFNQ